MHAAHRFVRNLNRKETDVDDRTGVMMSAALMLIAATQGTDGDVKQASRGYDGLAYLAGKYGQQAAETVEVIKRIFPVANGRHEPARR